MAEKETRDRGLHRHGDLDPSQWNEQEAVTGRPQDESAQNSTFADRAKGRSKAVQSAENKAVESGAEKASPRKRAPKRG